MQEMQEMWVQSLGQQDSLEGAIVIHSSVLSWRIPWEEEPSGLQSIGSQRVRLDLVTEHAGHRQEGYLIQRFLDIFEYRNFFLMGHHVRLMCYMVSDLLTHN